MMTKPPGRGASGASSVAVTVFPGVDRAVIVGVGTTGGACSPVGVVVRVAVSSINTGAGVGVAVPVAVAIGVGVCVGVAVAGGRV